LREALETFARFRFHNYASGKFLRYVFPQLDLLDGDANFSAQVQLQPIETFWSEFSSCEHKFPSLRVNIVGREEASADSAEKTKSK
jgi:hypothetical protein